MKGEVKGNVQNVRAPQSGLYYFICSALLFVVAAAASFNGFYAKYHFREYGLYTYPATAFDRMVDGTADRPFVFRQMLPQLANWIDQATPSAVKDRLFGFQYFGQQMRTMVFASPIAQSRTYFYRYVIVYAATYVFALLSVIAMFMVCRAAGLPPAASVFAPVIVILLLPFIMTGGGYFYDYPELAFLSLAFVIALKLDWWWIIPIAALGTWNKESFLLAIPTLYPLVRQRNSRMQSLIAIGVLGLVCASVYLPLHWHFSQNPGGTVLLMGKRQLDFYLSYHLLVGHAPLEMTYGILLPCAFGIVPLALLVWTVVRGWRQLPRSIQRYGQIAAIINVPLYLLFCYPGELRDFSLLYVVFLLVIAYNLNGWLNDSSQQEHGLSAGGGWGTSH